MIRQVTLCLFVLFQLNAFSQVVNIESIRHSDVKHGLHGTVDVGFTAVKNNTSFIQFNNRNNIYYSTDTFLLFGVTDFSVVSAEGKSLLNQGFEHLRYNYYLNKKKNWVFEAFEQMQYNQFQKMQFRALTGAGIRARISDSDSLKFYAGDLVMPELEIVKDDRARFYVRNSAYFTISFLFSSSMTFASTVYYQPRIDNVDDYRLLTETSMNMLLTNKLNFRISLSTNYDSNPPVGVSDFNYVLKNVFSYKF